MKGKNFLLVSLLVSTSLVVASCASISGSGPGGGVHGSGNVQTETREPDAFESISIEYPGAEIIIQPGDEERIEIEADDNLLPQLSTEVLSGRLTIKNVETDWDASVNPSGPVKITITVKDLTEIILSTPVGNLEVNDLQVDTLKLVLSGGGQVRLNRIQVDILDGELSGAGDIQAGGTANAIKLVLSGYGSFNAAELKSNEATIELSGMGDATVRVEKKLTATITGAGSVKYFGNPHVEQNVTSLGSVEPAE